MYSISSYELAKARVADLHRQAQRDALARAARQASRARGEQAHQPRHHILGVPAVRRRLWPARVVISRAASHRGT